MFFKFTTNVASERTFENRLLFDEVTNVIEACLFMDHPGKTKRPVVSVAARH